MDKKTFNLVIKSPYRQQIVKNLIDNGTELERTRLCLVSDEELESVTNLLDIITRPGLLSAMKMRCNANKERGLRIEKVILSPDLIGSPEEEKDFLREYFSFKNIKKQEEKLQKMKKKFFRK